MRSFRLKSLVGALLSAGAFATNCKETTFQVSGSALNRNISQVDLTDLASTLQQVQSDPFLLIPVSGNQTLSGIYCEATTQNSNNNKIQILFHSIVANRDGWAALSEFPSGAGGYQPDTYSYVKYMNNKGYPTLAIDRLGNGQSSHPEPILVNQGPYEDVLYHDMIQQVRSGNCELPRSFSHVTWVGNSYGSELGTTSALKYPKDVDEYILTGFSKLVQPSLIGIGTMAGPLPAAIVDPAKFGALAPGYVTTSIEGGRTGAFFGSPAQVSFDPEIAHQFFLKKDVVSVGQFITTYIGPVIAKEYTGRVLVLTGEQDQAFCGPGSPVIGPAHCGSLLRDTGSLFPAADYNYQSVDKTGHAIQLHYSAPKVYDIAARFLSGQKFAGGPS